MSELSLEKREKERKKLNIQYNMHAFLHTCTFFLISKAVICTKAIIIREKRSEDECEEKCSTYPLYSFHVHSFFDPFPFLSPYVYVRVCTQWSEWKLYTRRTSNIMHKCSFSHLFLSHSLHLILSLSLIVNKYT